MNSKKKESPSKRPTNGRGNTGRKNTLSRILSQPTEPIQTSSTLQERTLNDVQERSSRSTPKGIPRNVLGRTLKRIPKVVPEKTPKVVQGRTPKTSQPRTPRHGQGRMPRPLSERDLPRNRSEPSIRTNARKAGFCRGQGRCRPRTRMEVILPISTFVPPRPEIPSQIAPELLMPQSSVDPLEVSQIAPELLMPQSSVDPLEVTQIAPELLIPLSSVDPLEVIFLSSTFVPPRPMIESQIAPELLTPESSVDPLEMSQIALELLMPQSSVDPLEVSQIVPELLMPQSSVDPMEVTQIAPELLMPQSSVDPLEVSQIAPELLMLQSSVDPFEVTQIAPELLMPQSSVDPLEVSQIAPELLMPQSSVDPLEVSQIAPELLMPQSSVDALNVKPPCFRPQFMAIVLSPSPCQELQIFVDNFLVPKWPKDLEELYAEWNNLPDRKLWNIINWLKHPLLFTDIRSSFSLFERQPTVMPIVSSASHQELSPHQEAPLVSYLQELFAEWDDTFDNKVDQVLEWLGLTGWVALEEPTQVVEERMDFSDDSQ